MALGELISQSHEKRQLNEVAKANDEVVRDEFHNSVIDAAAAAMEKPL